MGRDWSRPHKHCGLRLHCSAQSAGAVTSRILLHLQRRCFSGSQLSPVPLSFFKAPGASNVQLGLRTMAKMQKGGSGEHSGVLKPWSDTCSEACILETSVW